MRKAKSFIALSVFALLVLAYAHTCSLSVSWKNFSEDSGDLLAAAFTLGIPHPTGYPLYVLLGRTFSLIMPGSIAFRITLLSLLCASLAPVLLFLTVARLLPGRGALLGATFASLSLGFSLHYWSQAVIAEVYALHILLTSVAVYALLRWVHAENSQNPDSQKPNTFLFLAAYALGLSFANHMLSLLTLVFGAVLVLSGSGRKRLSLRLCIWTLASFLIPLTLYAYLPLRSMKNPPLDWGNPETWDQLRWVVTGAQYRFRLLGKPLHEMLPRLWPGPFLSTGSLVALLALVGLFCGRMTRALRASLVAMLVAGLVVVVLYDIPDFQAYFLPGIFAVCFLAGAGFHRVVDACEVLLQRTRKPAIARYGASLAAVVLLLAAIVPAARENRKETDASADLYPYVFGRATFRVVEADALIVSEYDGRTFALWFFRETEYRETHPECIVVMKPLLAWPWYIDNLRELYPDLAVPEAGHVDEATISLVESNIDKRPVYVARDDPVLRQFFELRPVLGGLTPLFRVETQRETQVPNE